MGLGNACIDSLVQGPGFPDFAMNNTYGYQAYSEEVYEMAMGNLTAPETGCEDLIKKCREVAAANDPNSLGNDAEANEACTAATAVCFGVVQGAYTEVSNVSNHPPHSPLSVLPRCKKLTRRRGAPSTSRSPT